MSENIVIHWFRQDLRISDNPALFAASRHGTVLPIYILDTKNAGDYYLGAASRWWLHHSLLALDKSLNGTLSVYKGDPKKVLVDLAQRQNIKAIYWNRCYEPWRITRDEQIKKTLDTHNIETHSFNGALLWEPWEILKNDGTPYKVFTPFYKSGCLNAPPPRQPISKPKSFKLKKDELNELSIHDLGLSPKIKWTKQLEPHWKIGEENAKRKLSKFIKKQLANYKEGRNFPAKNNVSRLSPHLHFGEISPNQIWNAAMNTEDSDDRAHFLRELGWREFSCNLLYHFPELPRKNWQTKFDQFPWLENDTNLQSWQMGQTGYPLVDAGMRELWQTGYMHNRARMVVGSFLVKNLLLHWHHGERWFWDCLVDADLANNSAGWQWIAGCGVDATPYFRVFNPTTQGQKFDAKGEYTRQFVPELKKLPHKFLFNPWEAPVKILQEAGITLGKDYPLPIVDLKSSRQRALSAYQKIRV